MLPDTGSTTGGTAVPWNALIENFDDGDRRSTWGEDHGGGLWTTSASGVTAMIPSTSEFSSAITIQAGHWGRGLEVEYRAAPLITATATARLAMEKPLTALLQQADTLAFWARGDGQLVVELNFVWGATADAPARVRAGMATLNLAPGWRQYKVPVADAQAAGDGESRIRFTGSNGSLYRLDDIALIGTAR